MAYDAVFITTCIFRWLARLWNAVVVPRVEDAIISRVTAKRSSSSSSPSLPRQSPSNCGLSAGQQAVVKAALSILVNKAVLLGCPLPRHGVCVGVADDDEYSFTFHQLLFQLGRNLLQINQKNMTCFLFLCVL